ncbi:MAG: transcription antitermination factor NusB [Actinomycetes bacterium]|jgi:16S rRNA (cytosine967-C5)-methyltransferase
MTVVEALVRVERDDAYANLILPPMIRELEERDAAFATELTYGTLRMLGLYDRILNSVSTRAVLEMDIEVRAVLRAGSHQLLSMRTPPHAAVDTSVDIARKLSGQSGSKFVNALLRRVSERDVEEWISRLSEGKSRAEGLAIRYSHPEWIVNAYRDALGSWEECELLLAENNRPAPLTLVARPGRSDGSELVAAGAEAGSLSPFAYRWSGSLKKIAGLNTGDVGVQDEGSQLVAILATQAYLVGEDDRWLDLCAGPGGKASLLEAIGSQRGAQLIANEITPHRAELVRHVMMHPENVMVMDGTDMDLPNASFDRVLVDAPCSGLGALRRRPEARWRKSLRDLAGLVPLQEKLLLSALKLVRPGGLVAYVTCSPHIAETQGVVERILRDKSFEPIPLPAPYMGSTLQLWPHRDGTDAMFLALIRRIN